MFYYKRESAALTTQTNQKEYFTPKVAIKPTKWLLPKYFIWVTAIQIRHYITKLNSTKNMIARINIRNVHKDAFKATVTETIHVIVHITEIFKTQHHQETKYVQ